MNYVTIYRLSVRAGTFVFLLMVSLVCYALADHVTHQHWWGVPAIIAIGLAIWPLYNWLLDLPGRDV